ncbi:hypothetical protein EYF80_061150 [Liparis tanakae]|uniref:Uncharacterized protein n=1 Tax=Liparis tanakae TaxID=230148 RepID=A0A4Z2EK31_9TELE|nr:hypothetical protein EYF80_061150 [Liparis tanakae]
MGTIHSPSPLQYSLMGTSTSSALGMQLPLAITNEVDSAPAKWKPLPLDSGPKLRISVLTFINRPPKSTWEKLSSAAMVST